MEQAAEVCMGIARLPRLRTITDERLRQLARGEARYRDRHDPRARRALARAASRAVQENGAAAAPCYEGCHGAAGRAVLAGESGPVLPAAMEGRL